MSTAAVPMHLLSDSSCPCRACACVLLPHACVQAADEATYDAEQQADATNEAEDAAAEQQEEQEDADGEQEVQQEGCYDDDNDGALIAWAELVVGGCLLFVRPVSHVSHQ